MRVSKGIVKPVGAAVLKERAYLMFSVPVSLQLYCSVYNFIVWDTTLLWGYKE
jgi:hypothetical protein